MLRNICFLIFASILAAVHCQYYGRESVTARARNFSVELLHYTQLETQGHVVISPLGVWSLLTGVTLGAGGNSRKELCRSLLISKNIKRLIEDYKFLTKEVFDSTTNDVTLTSKNFIFADTGVKLKSGFSNSFIINFDSTVNVIDFKDQEKATEDANRIIQETGVIDTDVFNSNDFTDTRLILTNVISFKGLWNTPFNASYTKVEPFYDEDNKEIGKVNMMNLKDPVAYSNIQEMKARVLELPYGEDKEYCMLILLPYPRIKTSNVYQKLASISFPDIFARLQQDIDRFGMDDVNVKLPRFKISTNVILNKPLNDMGVYDIFDSGRADFGYMADDKLYVSAIVHKADIEVTESGTVASASTSGQFSDRMLPPDFHANRPFAYFIMHKPTATVIFSGIYSKPSIF